MCMLKTFQNKKSGPVLCDTYKIMIFLNIKYHFSVLLLVNSKIYSLSNNNFILDNDLKKEKENQTSLYLQFKNVPVIIIFFRY